MAGVQNVEATTGRDDRAGPRHGGTPGARIARPTSDHVRRSTASDEPCRDLNGLFHRFGRHRTVAERNCTRRAERIAGATRVAATGGFDDGNHERRSCAPNEDRPTGADGDRSTVDHPVPHEAAPVPRDGGQARLLGTVRLEGGRHHGRLCPGRRDERGAGDRRMPTRMGVPHQREAMLEHAGEQSSDAPVSATPRP